ncbi:MULTISPECIES: FkbM family methyltransferase [unclassified Brevibacterium]|uniref:FkbM family methyltransferase n=1 Tax=unclassified Brevibacterium TaxID=2614124 RepID=UPI0010920AFA|nr:FkbM family methyltransferase [Brevibacterium sp. S22]TGD31696.1 FkbM family methyltransferase [Brevibacterium sp. S22]
MNDHLRTLTARRQSWFGLKLPVKTALAQPMLHPLLRTIAPRIKGLKIGRLPAPIELTEIRGRAGGADFILVEPFRCEIAKEFYWGKGRRTEPEDAFALDLMVALSADADVFIDIGAYTGVFTMAVLAANEDVRAHVFEIIPAVVAGVEKNVDRNGFNRRVTIHPTGVGSPDTWMNVPIGDGGSALPSFYSSDMQFDSDAEVRFTSLNALLPEVLGETSGETSDADGQSQPGEGLPGAPGRGEAPHVTVKIDVEGGENDVFAHGQEFLAAIHPDILCEVLEDRAKPRELMGHLGEYGYHYYLIGEDRLYAQTTIRPDARLRDWLFTLRSPDEMRAAGYPVD